MRPKVYSGYTPRTGKGHGVDVLPVIRERHIRLAEANGVLARLDAIVHFKLFLGNALKCDKKVKGEDGRGSLPFEENTFRCQGFQHPADGDAGPESQRRKGWEGWGG